MRKVIKIKAYTILLAWFVIFMHSVVPHKHLPDNSRGCHELFHQIIHGANGCNLISKFEDQTENKNVCHFSSYLFHQYSQDNLIISFYNAGHFHPARLTGSIVIHLTTFYISNPYHGTSSLRAPPALQEYPTALLHS